MKRAIWKESKVYHNSEDVPRTQEQEMLGESYFYYEEVEKKHGKQEINGVSLSNVSRVIKTNAALNFRKGDIVIFEDMPSEEAEYKILEATSKLPDDEHIKRAVANFPALEIYHTIKTIYFQ